MAHITLSQLRTVLGRIVTWATSKFAARNVTSGKLEYADMPVVVLASMGAELDGTESDMPMSVGDTYFLPAGGGVGARIMFMDSQGVPTKISDPVSSVIYCNAYTGLLYRWDSTADRMEPVGGDGDGLRKVYVNLHDYSSLDALNSAENSGVYQIIDQTSQRTIGVLVVSCDNQAGLTPNFVTQWLFSNLELRSNSDTSGYSGSIDGTHYTIGTAHIIHRFYNASTSTSDIPLHTWSEWKVYGLTLDEMLAFFYDKVYVDNQLATKQDVIPNLATIIANAGKGVADVSSPQEDGSFTITLANGDTYTVNLNHQHTQYQPLLSSANAGSNITITTDQQTGNIIISATGGGGGGGVTVDSSITGASQANPVAGGAIYTALQGKANASEMDIAAVSNDTTKKNIQLKSGLSQTVVVQHQSLTGRVQSQDVVSIVKITQADYTILPTKDPNTLYIITES